MHELLEHEVLSVACGLFLGFAFGLVSIMSKGYLRVLFAAVAVLFTMLATGLSVRGAPYFIWTVLLSLAVYHLLNMMRLVENRLELRRLKKASLNSAIFFAVFQIAIVGIWYTAENHIQNTDQILLYGLLFAGLVWGLISSDLIYRWLKRSKPLSLTPLNVPEKEMPTVSLLIPARNEDDALKHCLESALSSNYPKLEILVLDDCSSDRTPQLIRQYAQAGIRFVSGDEPKSSWLVKNQAYDKLAAEASGEILMFIGVDTRLRPNSINYCLNLFLHKKLTMLCVMPKRGGQSLLAVLVQPMRYWLELVGSQYFAKRPPFLSTCWLIDRHSYHSMGGMKAVKSSILPELHFAKKANDRGKYYFARAETSSGIVSLKSVGDQINTAIRVRYPSLKRRLELVWLLSLLYFGLMVLPFGLIVFGFNYVDFAVWLIALIICVLLSVPNIILTVYSNPGAWWLSIVSFPIVVSTEIILMNISMWRYEFGTVEWKGRNICLPVMQVIPKLPKV